MMNSIVHLYVTSLKYKNSYKTGMPWEGFILGTIKNRVKDPSCCYLPSSLVDLGDKLSLVSFMSSSCLADAVLCIQ